MTGVDAFERAGRFLFRWRGLIGTLGFLVVFWLGRPGVVSCLAGLPLLLAGLGLRGWAMGYIGAEARAGEVGAGAYTRSGPYRWFKLSARAPAGHPLYFGNFLLVAGTLVCFRTPVLLGLAVVLLFLLEYLAIARAEERFLARKFRGVASGAARFDRARLRPEWRTALTVAAVFGLALWRALGGW